MILLSDLNFELPLRNPVIIFSIVLFIILFAPILLNKIKVPHIIGLIMAGVLIGPYGLNLLRRDSSIILFGTVGLIYIMFLAGLEIDLSEFKKNRNKIIVFGLTTFLLPFVFGTLASYYILNYSFLSSMLLASMFSTHTLISYPIASQYGVTRNRAVTLTIGGTMITDIIALLILAAIAGMSKGDVTSSFWLTLGISSLVFVGVIFFILPYIIRWFFKRFDDSVSQYIFVLAIVFLSSFLAEAAGIEAIIGAFFSGLILNRYVPHTSTLMNRIDFVGNALFIPFFLISVGMLVDITVLVKGWGALKVAAVIVTVAVVTKFLAARITQKAFKLSTEEGNMIFGLSTSHAAATLAIILVGYNIVIGETPVGEPIRLLDEDVLNGTILLILISCAISSFVVQKASRKIALKDDNLILKDKNTSEKILISLAYPETLIDLVNFGIMLKPKKSLIPVYALHVISEDKNAGEAYNIGKKMLDKAVNYAAASENSIIPLNRFDLNISNGIVYTIKEHNITDIVIGLHHVSNQKEFFGATAERIVNRIYDTIYIYKSVQPFNTLKHMVVVVTPKAEFEPGFTHWYMKLTTLAKEAGLSIDFYAATETIAELKDIQMVNDASVEITYNEFGNWNDFLIFKGVMKSNYLLTIVSSRKGHVSYNTALDKLPYYLSNYFNDNSFILIYPKQVEHGVKMEDVEYVDSTLAESFTDKESIIGRAANLIKKALSKDK